MAIWREIHQGRAIHFVEEESEALDVRRNYRGSDELDFDDHDDDLIEQQRFQSKKGPYAHGTGAGNRAEKFHLEIPEVEDLQAARKSASRGFGMSNNIPYGSKVPAQQFHAAGRGIKGSFGVKPSGRDDDIASLLENRKQVYKNDLENYRKAIPKVVYKIQDENANPGTIDDQDRIQEYNQGDVQGNSGFNEDEIDAEIAATMKVSRKNHAQQQDDDEDDETPQEVQKTLVALPNPKNRGKLQPIHLGFS